MQSCRDGWGGAPQSQADNSSEKAALQQQTLRYITSAGHGKNTREARKDEEDQKELHIACNYEHETETKVSKTDGITGNLHAAKKEKKIIETPHQGMSSLSCLYTQTHDSA